MFTKRPVKSYSFRATPYFRWYDLWVGLFWDRKTTTLYVGVFPTLGIKIEFWKEYRV